MFRTVLSIATLAFVFAAQPYAAVGQSQRSGRPAAKPAVTGTININTASAVELQTLPGVGAKTAERIVEYRQKNGPFKKVEELMNVRGVGEKSFLKLKGHLTVASAKVDHGQSQR